MIKVMKKRLDSLTFKGQLSILVVGGVLVLALITSLVVSHLSGQIVRENLVLEHMQVTQSLAQQSELALLTGSRQDARDLGKRAENFPGVKGILVITDRGETLYQSQGATSPLLRDMRPEMLSQVDEGEDFWLFSSPVYITEEAGMNLFPSAEESSKTLAGYVTVLVGKDTLHLVQANILRSQLIVSLGLSLLLLITLIVVTRRLTKPVEKLSESMLRATKGDDWVRAKVDGPVDIAHMQSAFNEMMEVLDSRQKALQEAMEAALESARVKGEFVANITHELRTPMNAVLGMLDLLMTMGLSQKQQEYVDTSKLAGQGLLQLIDEILDFSELDAGKMSIENHDCNLEELLDDVVGLLSGQALRKGVELGYVLSGDAPSVIEMDGSRLRQVLINLVGNAIKFTEQGEIAIRVSNQSGTGVAATSGLLKIEVVDTGIGMDEEGQLRIFDAFTQIDSSTTKAYKGTGLGLTISKQIVEKFSGTISVKSALGQGSCFTIVLPVNVVAGQVKSKARELLGKSAIVVSPSTIIGDFVSNKFQKLGVSCVWAKSGLRALEQLRQQGDRQFDIMLVEENLDDIQFADFLQIVTREKLISAKHVIALSNPWRSDEQEGRRAGLYTLNKPLRSQVIYQLMSQKFLETKEVESPKVLQSPYSDRERHGKNILVVDDNRANQQVAKAMLERLGFRADIQVNGRDAVEAMLRKHYDLVFMDCNMPVMDGYEATQQIRKFEGLEGESLPVIALTANTSERERQRCLDAGMSDFLGKPLSISALRAMLEKWLPEDDAELREESVPDAEVEYRQLSFDPQALSVLRDSVGEVLNSMIQVFLEDTPEYMRSLKSAIAEGDAKHVREIAHTIKGSAVNFGARELVSYCNQLEEQAANKDLSGAADKWVKIHTAFDTLNLDLGREITEVKDVSGSEGEQQTRVAERYNILIVDDDRTLRLAMAHALSTDQCKVEQAVNGAQALAVCSRQMPDMILMDALMPEMDGFEACEAIRELPYGVDVPILMITSLNDEESIVRAFSAGATDYVNKPVHFAVLKQRVSRLIQTSKAEKHVKRMAYHDQLTGLPNRANLMQKLRVMVNRAKIEGAHVALLFLDLDRFKMINDTMGHDAGDLLLKAVADRIRHCIRDQDFIARLGGDEFTIVLEGVTNQATVINVAKKIADTLRQPFVFLQQKMFVSVSIGISMFPDDGLEVGELIKHADSAMFKAKEMKSEYYFYEAGMEDEIAQRLVMERELRHAIDNNQLVLHYQPKVDMGSGNIIGAEALVRWQHPERGLLSPFHFIALAEETGLINDLSDWVLGESARQLQDWIGKGYQISVAANLSSKDLESGQIYDKLKALKENFSLPDSALELEITESMLMGDPDTMALELRRIQELGIPLSIDDFGSGFSSLSYLKKLPVDFLKIDRAFVKDIETDPDDSSLVTGIVALARSLNLRTIAEGVETERQREILTALGCDFYQGYFCSQPVPAVAFETTFLASSGAEINSLH